MNDRHLDKHEVEAAATGRWAEIYSALIPGTTDWDLIDTSPNKGTMCPIHGSKESRPTNLRRARTGWDQYGHVICNSCGSINYVRMFQELFGWDFPTILSEVWSVLGGHRVATPGPAAQRPVRERPVEPPKDVEKIRAAARALVANAVPLDHPAAAPVLKYLANRKIGPVYGPLPDILCVPQARYPHEPHPVHPVMLSIIRRATGEHINLHQTWLTPDGRKADVPKPKLLMTRMEQGPWAPTVQLDAATDILCLTEGIETALAVRAMIDLPTWAVVAAGTYDELELPERIKVVLVFADYDPEPIDQAQFEQANEGRHCPPQGTGLRKAQAFATRCTRSDRIVRVMLPTPPLDRIDDNYDWADYLADTGAEPAQRFFRAFRNQAYRDLKHLRAEAEQAAKEATAMERAKAEAAKSPAPDCTPVNIPASVMDTEDRYPFDQEDAA